MLPGKELEEGHRADGHIDMDTQLSECVCKQVGDATGGLPKIMGVGFVEQWPFGIHIRT